MRTLWKYFGGQVDWGHKYDGRFKQGYLTKKNPNLKKGMEIITINLGVP